MPVLPITKSRPDHVNWINVSAYMFFPDDKRHGREYKTALLTESILNKKVCSENEFQAVGGILSCIETLLYSPSYSRIMDTVKTNAIGGFAAGDMLLFMFRLNQIGLKPSIKKAVYLMEKSYSKNIEKMKGLKVGKSNISIRKNWKRFRSVSHLWAASMAFHIPARNGDPCRVECPTPFNDYLSEAEFFRCFGEKTISEKVNKPIFKKDELWSVPEDYPIPSCNPTMEETNDWLQKTIDDYSLYSIMKG